MTRAKGGKMRSIRTAGRSLSLMALLIGLLFLFNPTSAGQGAVTFRGLFISGPGAGANIFWQDIDHLGRSLIADPNWSLIVLANNVTMLGLVQLINRTFATADSNDISVLVYSGHGGFQVDGAIIDEMVPPALDSYDEYLASAANILDDDFGVGGLVGAALNDLEGHVITIFDSCYSGGMKAGTADLPIINSAFMSASQENQFSNYSRRAWPFGHPHSWFIGSLISGLTQDPARPGIAWADSNGDGFVTLIEWWDFANPKTVRLAFTPPVTPQNPERATGPGGGALWGTNIYSVVSTHVHNDPPGKDVVPTNIPSGFSPLAEAVYDKLFDIDEGGNLVPELAKVVFINPDRRTLEFHLRDGVLFHNGEVLTSGHVIENWTREVTIVPGSDPNRPFLSRPSLLDVGVVESLSMIDAHTFQVTLAEDIDPETFLEALTNIVGMIVYPEAPTDAMIGTGPFRIAQDEFKIERHNIVDGFVRLVRYEDYWWSIASGQPAVVREVLFISALDLDVLHTMALCGDLDIALMRGRNYYESLRDLAAAAGLSCDFCGEPDTNLPEGLFDYRLFAWVGAYIENLPCYPDGMIRLNGVKRSDVGDFEGQIVIGVPDLFGQ